MILLVPVLFAFGFVAYYEYTRIKRFYGGMREMLVFLAMMAVAALYAVAVLLDWPVPSPARVIQQTLGGIGEWIAPRE